MMPAPLTPWTEIRVERLVHLWDVDGCTALVIAERLGGTSRSAVLSKLRRLGKLGARRITQPRRPRRQKARPVLTPAPAKGDGTSRKAAHPPRVPLSSLLRAFTECEREPLRVSVLQLRDGDCRWPLTDTQWNTIGFCGHRAHGPYCGFHDRLAHQAG